MPGRDDEKRDEVIGEFLKGGPRSEEWRLWREALEKRQAALMKQREEPGENDDPEALKGQIEEVETQIRALATEEIISEFVESEVDLALNTAEPDDDFDGYSGNGLY